MKARADNRRLPNQPRRLTTVVILLLIIVGLVDAIFVALSTSASSYDLLEGRALAVANALSVQDVRQLEGNDSDLTKSSYARTRTSLKTIKNNNNDINFVYLLAKRENTALFLADSEEDSSKQQRRPGEVYPGASERLLGAFRSREPFIEGPIRDHRGIRVTGSAPIVDPNTQQVIAVIGMDVSASTFYRPALLYALVPLCLTAIPLAGLLRDRKLAAKEREITLLKSQFVSIASHELRSPMSGLLWAIQRMLKPTNTNSLSNEQQELLTSMYRSIAASMATINEILDFSIFERNQGKEPQLEQIELKSIMQDVRQTLELGAQEKQLAVNIDSTWPDKAYTKGDLGAVKRAFMNVVANAIKYGFENTTINIAYKATPTHHVVAIQDHGIGIPKDEQSKVMDGYYRATNASKVQSHGTGLGLWITKLVAEQYGGKVWLSSQEDKGTTIFVAFPQNQE